MKRGRPRLPKHLLKRETVQVYLPSEDADRARRSARAAGMSVSSWLRMVVRRFLGVE